MPDLSVIAGARDTRFLRLVERVIPKLAAQQNFYG
jgi:hypothetical protein